MSSAATISFPDGAEATSLRAAGMDSTAIGVRLSKDQVSIIWPGLCCIMDQFLTWEATGETLSFRINPPPPESDAGAFSARMMGRIKQLRATIQRIRTSGGEVWLNEFDLRAAIFAARTTVKLQRCQIRNAPKKGIKAKRPIAEGRRALKKDVARKKRVVNFLEIRLKRATRLFKSVTGLEEFRSQSKEWRSHLRWIDFHLRYFKPLPRSATEVGRLKLRRAWLDTLVQMAEKAIIARGYELPEPAELRAVLHRFLDYSLRRRMGKDNHIYMTRNCDTPVAQRKLLDFVEKRLALRKAAHAQGGNVAKPRKKTKPSARQRKPKQTAHRVAASDPEVRKCIKLLGTRWKEAKPAERRARVADLLGRGCSIGGLAKDLHQPGSVVRYYSKPVPDSLRKEKSKAIQAPAPAKDGLKQMVVTPTRENKGSTSAKDRPGGTRQQPGPSGKGSKVIPLPPPPETREEALPDVHAPEKEESLESLRLRLPQIIVEFIREKVGAPDTPVGRAQIQGILATLRAWSKYQPPNIYPRHLPNRLTVSQLYELTGVNFARERLTAEELGKWLAVLVHSLAPRPDHLSSPWEPEIAQAERQLIPQPQLASSPPPGPTPQRYPSSFRIATRNPFIERNRSLISDRTSAFRKMS
jgi:hypothetical protein